MAMPTDFTPASTPRLARPRGRFAACFALTCCLALAACSPKPGQGGNGQVAAVVNGVEITLREIDLQQQRVVLPNASAATLATQRRAILGELVSTELMAQQAVSDKLDKSPDYLLDAHLAQRQALARQVEQRAVRDLAPVLPGQASDVVDRSPRRFANRRMLMIEELSLVRPGTALLETLDSAAGGGASMDRLEQIVKEARVGYRRMVNASATDQLSDKLADALLAARPGQPLVVSVSPERAAVLVVLSIKAAPIVGDAATQSVMAELNQQQRQQAVQAKVKAVVAAAKIDYLGEFAPGAVPAPAPDTPLALPMGRPSPESRVVYRQIAVALSAALSCAMAVLLLVATLRFWRGSLWLPVLWRGKNPPPESAAGKSASGGLAPEGPLKAPGRIVKGLVALPVAGAVAAWAVLLMVGALLLPVWATAGFALIGLACGLLASYRYADSRLRESTRDLRWQPVLLLAVLLMGLSAATVLVS